MKTTLLIILLLIPALLFAWSENPYLPLPIDTLGWWQGLRAKSVFISPDRWLIFYITAQNVWSLKAQMLDAEGSIQFFPQGVIIDSYLWEAAEYFFYNSAEIDGEGGAIIVWENGGGFQENDRTYAQRINENGQLLWGANAIDLFPAQPAQFRAAGNGLVRDDNGYFFASAFWADHTKVYVQKFDVNGNLLWGTFGCQALNGQLYYPPLSLNWNPLIVNADGTLWVVTQSGGSSVRAQQIDSLGNLLWEPMGRVLFSVPQYNFYLWGIAPDHRGGVWVFYDTQSPGHMKVRRFDSEGNPASGEIVLLPYLAFEGGDIHADTSGGCYLAWSDSRYYPTFEVFAQHLDSLGTSLWPYGGINVNPAIISVDYNESFSDPTGLAVLWMRWSAWHDYVQRVDWQGNTLLAGQGVLVVQSPFVGINMWPDNQGGGLVLYQDDYWCAQRFWPSGFIGGGPTVHLEATPPESLQWVPVQGGPVSFRLRGTSWESMPLIYHLWAQAKDSAGAVQQEWQIGPGPQLDTLYQSFTFDTSLFVNAGLPGGNYTLTLIVGNYPDSIWGQDSQDRILFFKEPGAYVPPAEKKYGHLQFHSEPGPGGVTLRYELPQAARVRIVLFDLIGREVATVEDAWRAAGAYRVDIASADLPSGIYLCRLQAGDLSVNQKIVLTK